MYIRFLLNNYNVTLNSFQGDVIIIHLQYYEILLLRLRSATSLDDVLYIFKTLYGYTNKQTT